MLRSILLIASLPCVSRSTLFYFDFNAAINVMFVSLVFCLVVPRDIYPHERLFEATKKN